MNIVVNEDLIGNEDEADIGEWLVADGAVVAAGATIAQLETSKVQVQVEAPVAGTIRLLAAEGDVVGSGAVIATIE